MDLPVVNGFSLKYDTSSNVLGLFKKTEKMCDLKAKSFELPLFNKLIESPLHPKNCAFKENTWQRVKCLKIKEKRMQCIDKYPVTNGLLSIISCIALAFLSIPFGLPILLSLFDDTHATDSFFYFAERNFNRIRPVFLPDFLQRSINEEKKEILDSIEKIDKIYNQKYMDKLVEQHKKNIEEYGTKTWVKDPKARKLFLDMVRIKDLTKEILNRDLLIDVTT